MEVTVAPKAASSLVTSELQIRTDDGVDLFAYRWQSERPKAIVHIVHGMAEHAGRYARTAAALVAGGYAVIAHDHRGHGRTAPSSQELGYFAERNGFRRLVADVQCVQDALASETPELPRFLVGHSMGSIVVRDYMSRYASRAGELAGVVLSGTSGQNALKARGGVLAALAERVRIGARGRSPLLEQLSTGSFNRGFAPARTSADWLSRDEHEVEKFLADRLCGFALTTQGWLDVLDGVIRTEDQGNLRCIPRSLPIYLFSGALDPVGRKTRGVTWLIEQMRGVGLIDLTYRFYPDARHEMLNEVNRDEVHRDLIAWLDAVLGRPRRSAR